MTTSHLDVSGSAPSADGDLRTALRVAAWIVATVAYAWAVGWIFEVVQFAAARLPALATANQLSVWQVLGHGLNSTLLMLGVLAVGSALAYFSSARKWDVHGQDWHDIVDRGVDEARKDPKAEEDRGRRQRQHSMRVEQRAEGLARTLRQRRLGFLARVPAEVQKRARGRADGLPAGKPITRMRTRQEDFAVRLLAGFNIMILSALIAVWVARLFGVLFPLRPWATLAGWLGVILGVLVFLLVRWALTIVSPLLVPARAGALIWVIIAVATLFASAPLGVLLLTGVGVSTLGRRLARRSKQLTPSQVARSSIPWALLGITTVLGVAYSATPPVALPEVLVTTRPGATVHGGYVARDGGRVYLASCTGLADATSLDERLVVIPSQEVESVQITGSSDYLDSGSRPSLAKLAFHALGLGVDPPTIFSAPLRARHPTCVGEGRGKLSVGAMDPSLGVGVIAGPSIAKPHANDGETPIQDDGKTPSDTADLARRYQPSLLVTVADRNWPVSVNAVLAEQGPKRQPVRLVRFGGPEVPRPTAEDMRPSGATPKDYLQLPVMLGGNRSPAGQFQAFLRGQYQTSGRSHQWLADPGRLDPWYTAQIYFYDAGPIDSKQWPKQIRDPNVQSGLIGLEYWFYYPFNYYPLVVDSGLMNLAPIAGDRANVDLHQGDWEHVDVLLDPRDHKPAWLYLARHSGEGTFIPWTSPALRFDGTHPVIQAAFGGHPSYLPGCGPGPRAVTLNASTDWLSCGSGRFAFRGASTPLVNIQDTKWACWPGYFGEATPLEVSNSGQPEPIIDKVTHFIYVAGPQGPLIQGENKNVCHGGVPKSAYRPLSGKPRHR